MFSNKICFLFAVASCDLIFIFEIRDANILLFSTFDVRPQFFVSFVIFLKLNLDISHGSGYRSSVFPF